MRASALSGPDREELRRLALDIARRDEHALATLGPPPWVVVAVAPVHDDGPRVFGALLEAAVPAPHVVDAVWPSDDCVDGAIRGSLNRVRGRGVTGVSVIVDLDLGLVTEIGAGRPPLPGGAPQPVFEPFERVGDGPARGTPCVPYRD